MIPRNLHTYNNLYSAYVNVTHFSFNTEPKFWCINARKKKNENNTYAKSIVKQNCKQRRKLRIPTGLEKCILINEKANFSY